MSQYFDMGRLPEISDRFKGRRSTLAPMSTRHLENRSPSIQSIRSAAERTLLSIGEMDEAERHKARCDRYQLEHKPMRVKSTFVRKGKQSILEVKERIDREMNEQTLKDDDPRSDDRFVWENKKQELQLKEFNKDFRSKDESSKVVGTQLAEQIDEFG